MTDVERGCCCNCVNRTCVHLVVTAPLLIWGMETLFDGTTLNVPHHLHNQNPNGLANVLLEQQKNCCTDNNNVKQHNTKLKQMLSTIKTIKNYPHANNCFTTKKQTATHRFLPIVTTTTTYCLLHSTAFSTSNYDSMNTPLITIQYTYAQQHTI